MRIELRHLRTLCAIADTGSLGKAAKVLGISQPAMSSQLRRLEQMLGGQLCARSSSGIELTALGVSVVDQARDILARVDALARRPAPSNVDRLRLGATITPVLPGLVTRIAGAHPTVGLSVTSEYSTSALLEMLEADRIDAALVLDYPGHELRTSSIVAIRAFITEPTFVALPTAHPLAQRVEVPLDELSTEAWFVTPDDGAGWPGVFYDACADAGFQPIRVHEFLDLKNLPSLIAAGVGVTACQPTTRPFYGMTVRPIEGSPIRVRQLLAWRRDGPAAPLARSLIRYATEAYRELVAEIPHYHAWVQRHPTVTYAAPG